MRRVQQYPPAIVIFPVLHAGSWKKTAALARRCRPATTHPARSTPTGTKSSVLLDGAPVTIIPTNITGDHTVTIDALGTETIEHDHVRKTESTPMLQSIQIHPTANRMTIRNTGDADVVCRIVLPCGLTATTQRVQTGKQLVWRETVFPEGIVLLEVRSDNGIRMNRSLVLGHTSK